MSDIILDIVSPGRVGASPASYLGGEFSRYRDACGRAGATWAPDARMPGQTRAGANVTDLDGSLALTRELEKNGFAVRPSSALRAEALKRGEALAAIKVSSDLVSDEMDVRLAGRGLALYPFQREGVAFLRANHRRCLFDSPGCGKTIQALTAAPADAALLVVAPAVAKGVWLRECRKWRPDLLPVALSGKGSFRWPEKGQLVVTSYNLLEDEPGECPEGVVVILDEAQYAKNLKSARGSRALTLTETALKRGGRAWVLTGTPFENNAGELYSILLLVGAGESLKGTALANWLGKNKPEVVEGAVRLVALRRRKEDVLKDLPPKRRETLEVDISAKAARALDALLAKLGGEGALAHAVSKAQEAEKDAGYLPDFEDLERARACLSEAKVPAMLELVEEYEALKEPLVVMSDHLAPLEALKGREGWALLDGSVSPEKRTEIENAFQAGRLLGIAASIRASGVALTLTRAATMLVVSRPWNPAKLEQAEDRIWRIGQARGVLIRSLQANHAIDRLITKLCEVKAEGFRATVDAARVGELAAPVAELAKGLAALAAKEAPPKAPQAAPAPSGPRKWPNKVDARCVKCGVRVAVGTGWSWRDERGNWQSEHKDGDTLCVPGPRQGTSLTATVQRTLGGTPRKALDPLETWAAQGLATLAALDPDGALHLNGVGFAKSDVSRGHQLATLASSSGLTDEGWALAIEIAKRYAKTQLPEPPKEERVIDRVTREAEAARSAGTLPPIPRYQPSGECQECLINEDAGDMQGCRRHRGNPYGGR